MKNRSTGYTHLIHWKSNALNKDNCNYSSTLSNALNKGNCNYSSTLSLCNFLLIGYLPNEIDYLDDDNGFPTWWYSSKALETGYVAEVIHFKKYDTNLRFMQNPSICNINAFLIDKSYLAHEKDVLCDLHGH